MGKRSPGLPRRKHDAYDTPYAAIPALLPHLMPGTRFAEPCAGNGFLIEHLEKHGHQCTYRGDISTGQDALNFIAADCETVITNPPWTRDLLHPMILLFSTQRPCWLLFDADWSHTVQAAPYMPYCRRIVSVGRLKWIPDSEYTGMDNAAWYLFTRETMPRAQFFPRVP